MILSIQAHLDDRELNSCGILMSLKEILNTNICSLVFCNGREKSDGIIREQAHKSCSKIFGASDKILNYKDLKLALQYMPEISDIIYTDLKNLKPQCILFPSEQDLHQDHKFLSQASKIAIQRYVRDLDVKSLTCYEIHSPNIFSDLTKFTRYYLSLEEYAYKYEMLKLFKTEKLKPCEDEFYKEYVIERNVII